MASCGVHTHGNARTSPPMARGEKGVSATDSGSIPSMTTSAVP